MLARVAVVSACVLGAGLLGAGSATAEELGPEQARAFVTGKLFSYTCFEGTVGQGRIFPDGSVIGTIRMRGTGETRFAALPAGTIRVDGTSMCAFLPAQSALAADQWPGRRAAGDADPEYAPDAAAVARAVNFRCSDFSRVSEGGDQPPSARAAVCG